MNIKMVFYTLGRILLVEAVLLLFPFVVSFIYHDGTWLSFLIPAASALILGLLLDIRKPKKTAIYAREGFAIVGLSWIIMSLIGALPFVISGEIPSFIDAFFETVSGFTTTGGSILTDVEALSKSMLFWRSFTHWIGGMGVLVFILAILPSSEGQNIYIMRAESTGPQVGKLVSKVKGTARILYLIYFAMTVIETIMLWCGDMNFFEALVHSFGTAGTGGFGILNTSIGSYSSYSQIVIGVFMLLFGINFNVFYLILTGKFLQALKSEELRWYLGIIFTSVLVISLDLMFSKVDGFTNYTSYGTALKDSFFQVSSIITTTGYSTTDFNLWPALSKGILVLLMFVGACAGSTGGGIKVSRMVILGKSLKREISRLVHPHRVSNIRFEGTNMDEDVVKSVVNYFALIIFIFAISYFVVSFDGFDFETNFTSVAACLNNIGPGLGAVCGPTGNFSTFGIASKITFIVDMLVGRLEIYPILMLFNPRAWTNR